MLRDRERERERRGEGGSFVVLETSSFTAVGIRCGGAAWGNADPVRTVLVAEASLVGSIALAVW
jgi:hypothetical protein